MKTRVQLYTVPGQVFYNSTRKLVLKGADGVVFVADSQAKMTEANVESYKNLEDNLREMGIRIEEIPLVMQFNKRDLPNLSSIEEMNTVINHHNAPFYEAVATTGIGVEDTLKAVTKLVFNNLAAKYKLEERLPRARRRPRQRLRPAARPRRGRPTRGRPAAGPRAAARPAPDRTGTRGGRRRAGGSGPGRARDR
jgi:GTPase SAR1 family protein